MSRWLLVKNLPWTVEKKELIAYFSKYGKIGPIKLPYNQDTGMIRGYALLTYIDPKSYEKVLSQKQHVIDNEKILVTMTDTLTPEDEI